MLITIRCHQLQGLRISCSVSSLNRTTWPLGETVSSGQFPRCPISPDRATGRCGADDAVLTKRHSLCLNLHFMV